MKDKSEIDKFWEGFFMSYKWRKENDESLKKIASDLINEKIFCDRHLDNQKDLPTVFLPVSFMDVYDVNEKGGIDDLPRLLRKKIFTKDIRKKWNENIGLVYEYIEKSDGRGKNGIPMFLTMRLLSVEDTDRMFEFYKQMRSDQI